MRGRCDSTSKIQSEGYKSGIRTGKRKQFGLKLERRMTKTSR